MKMSVMYWLRFVNLPGYLSYTDGQGKPYSSPFSRCFSCKTAFLKWIFEADPVGVQIRAVSHFKGLEETFKMRYSSGPNCRVHTPIYFKKKFQPTWPY